MKGSQRRTRQSGQGLIEYVFIIVLVALVVIAILTLMGHGIGDFFSGLTGGL